MTIPSTTEDRMDLVEAMKCNAMSNVVTPTPTYGGRM